MKTAAVVIGIACQVTLAAPPQATVPSRGQLVYEARCRFCHDIGLQGAPRPGNRWVWPEPTGDSVDTLAERARLGKGMMQPMGTCKTCTMEDIRATVRYMIEYQPH
jgi:cytochrome c5